MDGLTELEQLKALLVVLTFGVAVAGLLLPSYGGLGARTNVALNLGAGGVVLSSAVVHLLPDAAEADGDFPWLALLILRAWGKPVTAPVSCAGEWSAPQCEVERGCAIQICQRAVRLP